MPAESARTPDDQTVASRTAATCVKPYKLHIGIGHFETAFTTYCPPPAPALTGKQVMSILESFVADNPDAADKPYGFALSASLRRVFPCTPG